MAEVPPRIGGICHDDYPRAVSRGTGDSQASTKQALIDSELLGMKNAFNNPEAL
jgi:hypothetical protein